MRLLRSLAPFLAAHCESLLYLLFGGLTFLVSVGAFALLNGCCRIGVLTANAISWFAAVTFAYLTNRKWVFRSRAKHFREILPELISFFGCRIATLLAEELILFVFVTVLHFSGLLIKTAAQLLVILLNYFLSKFFVFRSDRKEA